jgi:Leucine rich repeat
MNNDKDNDNTLNVHEEEALSGGFNNNNTNKSPGFVAAVSSRGMVSGGRTFTRVRESFRRKPVVIGTVIAALALVGVGLGVGLTVGRQSKELSTNSLSKYGARNPNPEVPPSTHQANKNAFNSQLVGVYQSRDRSWNFLSDENSPQSKAANWLTGSSPFATHTPTIRLQRYALATLYYATFLVEHPFLPTPTDWARQDLWITNEDECSWMGVACNNEGHVMSVILPGNALSGQLPFELSLLEHLEEIDLSSNFIYCDEEQHDVWIFMKALRTLKMEDNFVVTESGLPTQFVNLASLEKLQMSYNLLQGPLSEQVFSGMQKLQHLEIESNYLSGPIPAAVGQLPDLVYLYARRNSFTIHFPSMVANNTYPSLFSLWLDNNDVTGSIPTTIGLIKELASFSITNAALTGSIPTEFGNLIGLKRVWLYNNQITGGLPTTLEQLKELQVFEIHHNNMAGLIPSSICTSVKASDYQFKALSVDCEEIDCKGCCTTCY